MSVYFAVGSVSRDVCAKDHAICEGPIAVAMVFGAGYPLGRGWHPRTEALTRWIVEAMNEKVERDGKGPPRE